MDRYTWTSYGFAALAVVPLMGNQSSMPAKNGIGREQSTDLCESLATKDLALYCQSASLVVVEQDAFRAVASSINRKEVAVGRGLRGAFDKRDVFGGGCSEGSGLW